MTAPTTVRTVADHWLTRSGELTALVDRLADRRDLLVKITDRPVPAPGMFVPASASITLDANVLLPGVDPATITLRTTTDLANVPVVAGCLAHEVSHADHSVWPKGGLGPHQGWVTLLEEPRIETVMARTRPHTRVWLQASAAHILGNVAPTDVRTAVKALILVGGRLLGGVLDPHDDLDLDAVCAPFLTAAQIATVTEAVADAVEAADGDIGRLQGCAARIAAVLEEQTSDFDDDDTHVPGTSGTPVQEGAATGDELGLAAFCGVRTEC